MVRCPEIQFTIPMRGNEICASVATAESTYVYDPHEG